MDGEIRDSITRVEGRLARIEDDMNENCRRGEESIRELRKGIDVCLDGWVKTVLMGATVVTSLAVIRR
ncbi:MAG: hypothetical protein QOF06_1756 [Solirubrobacterales bacterium]|jgi:hypothetical protein|nr:hypothetical protein [Solirubrobacterales bacterium]